MYFRKLFNWPSRTQTKFLDLDETEIFEKCSIIAQNENSETQENQKTHDNFCLNCKAKSKIVDRIAKVHGVGNFKLTLNGLKGVMSIDTEPVRHCTTCGHEWVKFQIRYVTKEQVLKVAFKYLADVMRKREDKRFSWKMEVVSMFNGCYAESIYRLVKEYEDRLHENTRKTLTLENLRKHYKSIYDI